MPARRICHNHSKPRVTTSCFRFDGGPVGPARMAGLHPAAGRPNRCRHRGMYHGGGGAVRPPRPGGPVCHSPVCVSQILRTRSAVRRIDCQAHRPGHRAGGRPLRLGPRLAPFAPSFRPLPPNPSPTPPPTYAVSGGTESWGGGAVGFAVLQTASPCLEHRPRARVAPACVDRGNRHIPRPEPRVRLLVPGRILPVNRRPLLPVCYATHSRLGGRAQFPPFCPTQRISFL